MWRACTWWAAALFAGEPGADDRGLRWAATSEGSTCLLHHDGDLEVTNTPAGRSAHVRVAGAAQVVAAWEGCASRKEGNALFWFGADGSSRALGTSVTAFASWKDNLLVASSGTVERYVSLEADAERLWTPGGHVSAVAANGNWAAAGRDDGSVEILSPSHAVSGLQLTGAESSPVTALAVFEGMVAAGHANGEVRLWAPSGVLLQHTHLHGSVRHIRLSATEVFASSELGSHARWDLSWLT